MEKLMSEKAFKVKLMEALSTLSVDKDLQVDGRKQGYVHSLICRWNTAHKDGPNYKVRTVTIDNEKSVRVIRVK